MPQEDDPSVKVLLINPYYPISETPSPPLGLAYLAGALEEAGVEVKVLDFVVYPYSRRTLEEVLTDFGPDLLGVTSVTMTFDNAIKIINDAKAIAPDVLTVMGGPHATFRAEKTLQEFPHLDMVVKGEGEPSMVELVKQVSRRRRWEKVPSLVYRDGDSLQSTPIGDYKDVDQLPMPSRHLLPLGRYKALGMPITMTTSRGCPFKCIFCVGRKMGGSRVRLRSPGKVVDEFESLARLGFTQINIADDLFTANKDHCLTTCNEIQKRGLSFPWSAFARVDTIAPALLNVMKGAGCRTISFGVESADPEILRTIRKGITPDQVVAAVEMCMDAGISPHASFILGLPGETASTIKRTIEFAEGLKQMGASYGFHLLGPFPGTEVRERARELGIRILTDDWSQYHANRAIVETTGATKEMMDSVVEHWEKKFLDWLGYIEKNMESGTASNAEVWQYKKLRYCSIIYELMMNSALEENGIVPGANAKVEGLQRLAGQLSRQIRYGRDEIAEALDFAAGQGTLICTEKNGALKWQWNDELP